MDCDAQKLSRYGSKLHAMVVTRRGASAPEYALLLVGILLVVTVGLKALGGTLNKAIGNASGALGSSESNSPPGSSKSANTESAGQSDQQAAQATGATPASTESASAASASQPNKRVAQATGATPASKSDLRAAQATGATPASKSDLRAAQATGATPASKSDLRTAQATGATPASKSDLRTAQATGATPAGSDSDITLVSGQTPLPSKPAWSRHAAGGFIMACFLAVALWYVIQEYARRKRS
ncbi:MAG: hypothetical protein FWD73_10985 [Polyangiaceae bacterium]|nr:hypothetical protein [Polyangiaceae bacterium]